MKTASLLLAFPLLLPVCTAYAAPRELRADGRYEFLEAGKKVKYTIAKDEVYRRNPTQGSNRVFLSARKDAREVQAAARQLSSEVGDLAEMVAYPEGQTPTDENRRVVSRSVILKLADGLDPMVVASAVNAKSCRGLIYAPGYYNLRFNDSQAALSAAEDLKGFDGISEVTVELARKFYPKALPAFADPQLNFATTDKTGQFVDVQIDLTYLPAVKPPGSPWRLVLNSAVKKYQWWLRNTGEQVPGTLLFPGITKIGDDPLPPSVYSPDDLPKFALSRANDFCQYPPFFDILADINVFDAWSNTTAAGDAINGNGVRVAVLDDGIQVNHEDLSGNLYDKNHSYNFLNAEQVFDPTKTEYQDPTPPSGGIFNHGTGVAGLIFGRANTKGGVGVAYGAKMMGLRFAGTFTDVSVAADAMAWGSERILPQEPEEITGDEWRRSQPFFDVAVCAFSQSPSTSGTGLSDVDLVMKRALAYGALAGRNNKGVIYLFPAGNEAASHGNANYSYLSNSVYTVHVGAVSDLGRRVLYSSPGACVHVVAPSLGWEMPPAIKRGSAVFPTYPLAIPEADLDRALGYTVSPDDYDPSGSKTRNTQYVITTNSAKSTTTGAVTEYNNNFEGTSASTAMVGGVVALMLQANPNLGYRDVQEILMRSARVVDPLFGEWSYNSMGMPVSHKYGAGLVDAAHAVAMSRVWKNNGTAAGSPTNHEPQGDRRTFGGQRIPRVDPLKKGVTISLSSPSFRVEQVKVALNIVHGRVGDLGITLKSPRSGQADEAVESFLYIPHRENINETIDNYEFTTVRHWGTFNDNPVLNTDSTTGGNWELKIWDNTTYGKTGSPGAPAVDPNSTKIVDGVFVDRVIVPVGDPQGDGVLTAAGSNVTFYGSTSISENQSPVIATTKIVARPGKTLYAPIKATTDLSSMDEQSGPRAPMLGYYFKVLGSLDSTKTLYTSPNNPFGYATAFPNPEEKNASFRFDPNTGVLTNVMEPKFFPLSVFTVGTGEAGASTVTLISVSGLKPGMYASGTGISNGTRIADNGIDAATGVVTLTKPNGVAINGAISFNDFGLATGAKDAFTVQMTGVDGLVEGMYVNGQNIAPGTRIARGGINKASRTLTLTAANLDEVREQLFFSDLTFFNSAPLVVQATGTKNSRQLTLKTDVGQLATNQFVSGKGIGAGATITSIDADTNTISLSAANTADILGTVNITSYRPFESLVAGRWNVEASATNIFGTTRRQFILEVKDQVTFDEWATTYYPPITDPKADPDNDGLTNLMEFVSGGDPYVADSQQMPSSALTDGKLVFTYQVDANALGAKVEPRVSSDLINWVPVTPVAGTKTGSITSYSVTLDTTDPRKFFRLYIQG